MRYRVHYSVEDDRLMAEVEATSPTEAVIKFRHTRCDGQDRRSQRPDILSVSPEPSDDELTL